MNAVSEGDVLAVVVRFSGLPIGLLGVCMKVDQKDNGTVRLTILMQNERVVTLTARETYMFLRNKGTLDLTSKTNKELIHQLEIFINNQQHEESAADTLPL